MASAHLASESPLRDTVPPSARRNDRWFVTNGIVAVGPVSFELLIRGAAHGRIPSGSFVRHESWQVWRRLDEIESMPLDGRQQTVEDLAKPSETLESRASNPLDSVAPPPPDDLSLTLRPSSPPPTVRSTFRAAAVDPVGVLSHAFDLGEALLLAISTAVTASGAEVGLVHRARHDLRSVVTVGGHGPRTERLLGERIAEDDPTLDAARNGYTVISEPGLGCESRYVLGRMMRCLPDVRGVAMVPLCLYGELVALLEVGRGGQPFRAREIARMEDVVEVLTERAVLMGWLE
ncbi:MAG TPA: DUF4339 domain-containing protein [Polyangiaceae bacterium]